MFSYVRNQVNFRLSNLQKQRATTTHHDAPSIPAQQISNKGSKPPAVATTMLLASLYVLSGVTQPLIMTLAKEAGLADPPCQVYMLFYYQGPASVVLILLSSKDTIWPSKKTLHKALLIACCDLVSQTINYTGSSMAGPTNFGIVYSSIAVWTAVFSRILLKRTLALWQWMGVLTVFCG